MVSLGTRAFIVTDRLSAKLSGAYDDLMALLDKLSISYTVFDEISENPDTDSIIKGSQVFMRKEHDFIIAIGGGSPLDAGKAISLAVANRLTKSNIYDLVLHKKAYPIVAIPTTAGTGSEVTPYSVLTDTDRQIKAGFGTELIFPKYAFLDPRYTLTCPTHVTKDTAIDALSHLLEGLYSVRYDGYLLPFIYRGVQLVTQHLLPCLADPNNLTHRQALMLAANYGGVVIAHTSTTLQHSIGYPLTTLYGLSHGMANAVVMKNIMELFLPYSSERLDGLFEFLGTTGCDFFTWLDSVGMQFPDTKPEHPSLDDFLKVAIPNVMNSRNMALNPGAILPHQIENIYRDIIKIN